MNSSGAYIERLKCRSTNCVKSPSGDCICVYGTVGVTGPVEVYGMIGVTGIQVGLTGAIGITGPVTVNGVVGVTGPVQVYGTVGVTGIQVGLTGAIGITGPVTVNGVVGVTGPVEVYGMIGVTGIQVGLTGAIGITGPVTVNGAVGVTGTVGITGPVTVQGVVGVTGPVEVYGMVGVTGPVTVQGVVGVSGTVGITGPVTVNGVIGITGPVTVQGTMGVSGTVDITTLSNTDAFGRLRVSNPYTLYEFTSILGKQPDSIDEGVTGSGSATGVTGSSYISMNVSGTGSVIRQSHEYIIYQPGKSKLVYMTGVLQDPNDAVLTGVTTRIGCFDADMGFYIESDGGVISVVKHNSSYEKAYRVPSSSNPVWLDPLNGSGPSGITVNFRKAQIFVFDFEWLGVGQVRCGVVVGGQTIYYYKFTHINTLTMPYIPMAKLPLRYEIIGTDGSASNEMRMLCGTVLSEGGFTPLDRTIHLSNYLTGPINITTGTTLQPLFALKLRPDFPDNRVTIKLKAVDIFNTKGSNSFGSWVVLLNPTLTGGTFTNVDTDRSSAQSCTSGMTTVSGGSIIYSGFYSTRDTATFSTTADELVASKSITTGLSGNSDVVVLCANDFSGGTATKPELYYFFTWIEYI